MKVGKAQGPSEVLRKLGVEEWIVQMVQGMYANVRSCVRVDEAYSEEFEVMVSVHQGFTFFALYNIMHEKYEKKKKKCYV